MIAHHGEDAAKLGNSSGEWWDVAKALDISSNGFEIFTSTYALKERRQLVRSLLRKFS